MQQLNAFLQYANYRPVFQAGNVVLGLTVCAVVVVLLLHTLHVLGRRSPLYQRRKPVDDWNKRFYPACVSMIIFLLILMWLLSAWSHVIVS